MLGVALNRIQPLFPAPSYQPSKPARPGESQTETLPGQGAGTQLTSWGQGASVSHFSGAVPGLALSGEAATGALGMDYERGSLLAGFAMTHSLGAGTAHGADRTCALGSTVTTMLPYARFALTDRISPWGLAGTGSGELTLELDDAAAKRCRTDLAMTLAAAGVRGELRTPAQGASGFALALNSGNIVIADHVEGPVTTGQAFSIGDVSSCKGSADPCADVQRVVAAKISEAVVTARIPIKVTKAQANGTFVLNCGNVFLKEGDVLSAFSVGEQIVDPDSNEVLGAEETLRGSLVVTESRKKFARARYAAEPFEIANGDVRRRPAQSQAKEQPAARQQSGPSWDDQNNEGQDAILLKPRNQGRHPVNASVGVPWRGAPGR